MGLVTGPHARTPPRPQPMDSGPPAARPEGGQPGEGERPTPDAPHPGKRRPPRHAHAACTALKSARCGVGDGSPRPHPPAPIGSG